MKISRFFLLGLVFASLVACSKDDDGTPEPLPAPGAYAEGIFILNEGNFQSGNASVTFVSQDFSKVVQGIFRSTNHVSGLGDTATEIGFYDDYAFIVVNVSNKVEIVDRNTWELVGTIDENLNNPRKIAFSSGKAYVTNWGDGTDPNDDYVAVFSVPELDLVKKIPVEEGPEDIIAEGDKIYVAHSGGFSFNHKVTQINPIKDMLIKTVQVGEIPNAMAVSGNALWVTSSGLPSYADGGETAGSFSKIDLATGEVLTTIEFSSADLHPANLTSYEGSLYYTLGNSIHKFDPEENLSEITFLEPNEVDVLYGFTIWDNKIFVASANTSFTGNGRLLVYDLNTKELLYTFDTGINPNGIFINE